MIFWFSTARSNPPREDYILDPKDQTPFLRFRFGYNHSDVADILIINDRAGINHSEEPDPDCIQFVLLIADLL